MPAFNPLYQDNITSFSYGASRGYQIGTSLPEFYFGDRKTGTTSDFDTTVRPLFTDGVDSPYAGQCKTVQNLIDDGVITNSTTSAARNYVCYTIIAPISVGGAPAPYVEFGVGYIRRRSSWPYPHVLYRTLINNLGYLIYQKNAGTEAGTIPRLRGDVVGNPTSYNVFFGFPQTRAVYSGNHHAAPTMEGIATELTLALSLYSR